MNNGKIFILAEEKKYHSSNETITLKLAGSINDYGKLFFIIWKVISPGKYTPVYKSEI